MTNALLVNAVYVLSVRSFTDRIEHIRQEMARHAIPFEFIFEHDIPELSKEDLERYFPAACAINLPQQSLVLKHIKAWRHCVENGFERVLVFEDDVFLHSDFTTLLNRALQAEKLPKQGYLLFLGGADTRVPKEYFLERGPVFQNPIATADGYVTDAVACARRLDWIAQHKANLPADHLLKHVDAQCGTAQYWTTTALVQQGSVFGSFTSTLDNRRQQHSNFFNNVRYQWKIFQRRTLPGFIVRLLNRPR